MNMTDQVQLKSQVIQAVEGMEPRNVVLVYRFIQRLTGKGRREHDGNLTG